MKNAIKKTNLFIVSIGLLASCSFSLSSRSIASGCSILNDYLATINETPVQVGDGASFNIEINESVEDGKNKGKTTLASYTCTAIYTIVEAGYQVSYIYDNGDGVKQSSVSFANGIYKYTDENGTRDSQPSDPMYVINSFESFVGDYVCKSIGSMFQSYFNAVLDDAASSDKASILTGCNVDSTENSQWDFKIFSEYNTYGDERLGFDDEEYENLFVYSNIEMKPAYSIEMKLLNGKMTKIAANYSYALEGYDNAVEGNVNIRISYGK